MPSDTGRPTDRVTSAKEGVKARETRISLDKCVFNRNTVMVCVYLHWYVQRQQQIFRSTMIHETTVTREEQFCGKSAGCFEQRSMYNKAVCSRHNSIYITKNWCGETHDNLFNHCMHERWGCVGNLYNDNAHLIGRARINISTNGSRNVIRNGSMYVKLMKGWRCESVKVTVALCTKISQCLCVALNGVPSLQLLQDLVPRLWFAKLGDADGRNH